MSNAVDHYRDYVSMSADVDDHPYAGSGVELDPQSGGLNFKGLDPFGICGDGREIVFTNVNSTNSVTLKHDASATTGNGLFFDDGVDHVLGPFQSVWALRKENVTGRIGWWLQF